MRAATDHYIIHSEQTTNNRTGTYVGGKELLIDTDFGRHKHAIRIGTIHTLPLSISDTYINNVKLEIGDKVVIHHFVIQPENKIANQGNLYLCKYLFIYAVIKDNEIMPIEDLIFVEPMEETDEDTTKGGFTLKTEKAGKVRQKGKVFACSKRAREMGIMPTDIVYFTSHGDYKINIVGHDLYRMKIRNIIAVERNGELECMNGRILVEVGVPSETTISENDKFSMPKFGSSIVGRIEKLPKGVNSVEVGQIINYANCLGNEQITHKGKTLTFVQETNINYFYESQAN